MHDDARRRSPACASSSRRVTATGASVGSRSSAKLPASVSSSEVDPGRASALRRARSAPRSGALSSCSGARPDPPASAALFPACCRSVGLSLPARRPESRLRREQPEPARLASREVRAHLTTFGERSQCSRAAVSARVTSGLRAAGAGAGALALGVLGEQVCGGRDLAGAARRAGRCATNAVPSTSSWRARSSRARSRTTLLVPPRRARAIGVRVRLCPGGPRSSRRSEPREAARASVPDRDRSSRAHGALRAAPGEQRGRGAAEAPPPRGARARASPPRSRLARRDEARAHAVRWRHERGERRAEHPVARAL